MGCFYRPPNTDISMFSAKMNEILEILESEKKEIYLLGDFNINLLNYNSHGKTKEFLDMMYSFNIYPLITKPTRISANRASLIDNIYTNTFEKRFIIESSMMIYLSIFRFTFQYLLLKKWINHR